MSDQFDFNEFLDREVEYFSDEPINIQLIVGLASRAPAISVKSERIVFLVPKLIGAVAPPSKAVSMLLRGLGMALPKPIDTVTWDDAVVLHWCGKNASRHLLARKTLEEARARIATEYGRPAIAALDQIQRSVFSLESIGAVKIWGEDLHICEKVYLRGVP